MSNNMPLLTPTPMSPMSSIRSQRQTLLAVDDDTGNLRILGQLLQPHFDVLLAPTGERALQVASRTPKPDLILLDVLMPVMDGYAILAKLRENPATRDIPVIFVTALDAAEDEQHGLERGAVDYITKPYKPAIILARIRTHLELQHARNLLRDQNILLEAEVARREATLHTVTTATRDALIMMDGAWKIAFWNPAAENMFSYTAAEAHGQDLRRMLIPQRFHAATAQQIAGVLDASANDAAHEIFEWVVLRKDGTEFPAEVSLAGIRRENAWWSLATLRDITERKALNDKLAQAQQHLLQSDKLAAIGQLAAGVAHEINNPVGFVKSNLGSLELYVQDILEILEAYETAARTGAETRAALDRAQSISQEKDLDYLRTDIRHLIAESQDGLERVRRIVQDLKGFARVEDNDWQWTDLHGILESTLNIVWNELKYHCTLHKEYADLPSIWCLPSQLSQVFMNLLVNAGHAIVGKGDITIQTMQQGEEVCVVIADTGCGISPENQHRLFDPFFTTKPVGKGTGLGLSVAWGIVQKHHGRIEVQSEVGKGATFMVWLPINSATPPTSP
jgi:PAS domain S-box-containing protein